MPAVMALLAAAAGAPSAAEQPAGRIYARRRVGRGGAGAGSSSAPAAAAAEPPNTPPNAAAPTAAAPTAAPNAAGPDNASDGENSDVAAAEEHDDGDEAAETTDGASAWKPEDDFRFSQRVKTMGDERRFNPILNLAGYSSKGVFEYAEHFLPMHHGARTTRALVPHLVPPPRQPTRPAAAFKHEMVASREGQKAGQREG